MSSIPSCPDELRGLARVIDNTLRSHPDWYRLEDGRPACDGESCNWVKPTGSGNGIGQHWRKHQKFVLMGAISYWWSQTSGARVMSDSEETFTLTEADFMRELADAWETGRMIGRIDMVGAASNPYRAKARVEL